MIVVWFSCGAASAAALKLTLERFPDDDVRAVNQPIAEEHPDNRRFLRDVADRLWFWLPAIVFLALLSLAALASGCESRTFDLLAWQCVEQKH